MVERKPRSHSRTEQIPNKASTSSTSSPILVDQNVSDQGQDHQQYVPLTTSPGQGFPGSGDPLMGAATLPSSKESTLRSSLSSLQSFDRNTLWDNSSFISQSPSSDLTAHPSSEDLSRSVWSFAEPHLAVGYPPFSNPPSTMTRSSGGNGLPLGASGENTAWGPSTHPTSVATMDELPSNYHDRVTQSFHASNPYRNRVSTDVYTPSLHASNHSSSTTNSEYRPTSTSGSIIQDQAGAFDFPPSWVPVLGPQNDCIPGKEADSMSVWYSEPSQLQQVDEEQLNYPYSGDAPQYYSSASQYP
ncbi:MAG: hypothetical protein M1834_009218 [Cirrosporium novae-zelandiae]|nr:MAG: hypothetical protein M1834_009218 [Cirrosporium novae-zelandiae]